MSDERLRELERRAAAEGTVETAMELLRHRIRVGDLAPEWLEAAAMLGDPAARKVLGRFVKVVDLSTARWVLRREASGDREISVRLSLAAAEARLQSDDSLSLEAIDAARTWLTTQGCAEAHDLCVRALERTLPAVAPTAGEDWEFKAQYGKARLGDRLAVYWAHCAVSSAVESEQTYSKKTLALLVHPEYQPAAILRGALLPWALRSGRTAAERPPKGLVSKPLPKLRARAIQPVEAPGAKTAFARQLAEKQTKSRATEIRKSLRAKLMTRDKVSFAARLGDPAACLVAKLPDNPDLSRPSLIGGRITQALIATAKPVTKAEYTRLRRSLGWWKGTPYDKENPPRIWPEWSRLLVSRLALEIGRALLARLVELGFDDSRPREALDLSSEAFFGRLDKPAFDAAIEGAKRAAGARGGSAQTKAAARGIYWACDLVRRCQERAREPKLNYSGRNLPRKAIEAGIEPAVLWRRVRETAVSWALAQDEVAAGTGVTRSYSPKESFGVREPLVHKTFGRGVVSQVKGSKIEVSFPGGSKWLVHAPGDHALRRSRGA